MAFLQTLILSLGSRLLTAKFAEWVLLWAAKILVKKTDTPYDDQLLAEIEKALAQGK